MYALCVPIFDGRLYQHVDGVAMGSSLGPLFANIFMSYHEQKWLNSCPSSFKPLLYRRYVDDCFLLFRSLDHVQLFLDYLNRQHASITFTAEMDRDGKLPFLDIDISCSESKFATSVYCKPTFTGLFTNFHKLDFFAALGQPRLRVGFGYRSCAVSSDYCRLADTIS